MTGLRFQTITVQSDGGYNDGTDNFVSDSPSNDIVLNARFDERNQIAKRFGFVQKNSSISSSVGSFHSIVDVDGIQYVVGMPGTFRYDPVADVLSSASVGAPKHIFVKSDPIVRTNNQTLRPDTTVIHNLNLLCQTWEDVGAEQAYSQFFTLVGEDKTPVAISEAKIIGSGSLTSMKHNVHTIAVNNTIMAFGIGGISGSIRLLVSSYDTTSDTYSFNEPINVDVLNSPTANDYAICADRGGNDKVYIAYRAGGGQLTYIKSFDSQGNNIATAISSNTTRVLSIWHHGGTGLLTILHQDGTITSINDSLLTAPLSYFIFNSPSAAYQDVLFRRGIIMDSATPNCIWIARSTATFAGQNVLGNYTALLQIAEVSVEDGGINISRTLPRMTIVSQGGYLSDIGVGVFAVADQLSFQTKDRRISGFSNYASLAAPVCYIVQPVINTRNGMDIDKQGSLTPVTTMIDLVPLARCLQDKIGTIENGELFAIDSTDFCNWHTSNINATTSDNFIFFSAPTIIEQIIDSGVSVYNNLSFYRYNADLVRCKIQNPPAVRDVQASNIRLLGGGFGTSVLDSVHAIQNTPDPPTVISIATPNRAYNALTPTYSDFITKFVALYRWIDEKGNIHRSSPSSMYEIGTFYYGITGSAGQHYPWKLRVPNPYPTGLLGDGIKDPLIYQLEIYGQYPTGSVFRRIGIVNPEIDPDDVGMLYTNLLWGGLYTDPHNPQISSFSGSNGINITNLGSLYDTLPELFTESDELGPWPSPPFVDLVSTQSRLWGISAESRLDVWYTKPITSGYAPEFASELVTTIPQEGGECVALAALDDKVIVFKQRKIFALYGDPGDKTGANSSLQKARLISGDVGCISAQSVVEGPFGVVFQSERGFYLIDKSLAFSFIGEDVKNYQDPSVGGIPYKVTSATLVPSISEVRWSIKGLMTSSVENISDIVTDTNYDLATDTNNILIYQSSSVATTTTNIQESLVWNYRLSKWSKNDIVNANDSCISNGVYTYVTDDGHIIYETPNMWNYFTSNADNTSNPRFQVQTSWLKFGNLANYKRVRKLILTLRWFGAGEIQVKTRTDYSQTYDQTRTWTEAQLNSLVDSGTNKVQLVIQPVKQKCEAIQISIVEPIGTSSEINGRAFELVSIQAEVGLENNHNFPRIGADARK